MHTWTQLNTRLKRYLGRILKRPEDVEDIAQEAFTRVLEAGTKGQIQYPNAYLFRTARNLALNSLARKYRKWEDYIEDISDTEAIEYRHSLEDQIMAQQRFEQFCHATTELPEQCRKVLVLRKVYGLSQKEVACRLGISGSTVEKHLAKGLVRCASYLNKLEATTSAMGPKPQVPSYAQNERRESTK